MPLFVCGSEDDLIIGKPAIEEWKPFLKAGDRYNLFPNGRHFFHYFYAQEVGKEITKFWQSLPSSNQPDNQSQLEPIWSKLQSS
jgi:surfactin synthase thioesterase subunit